jgi:hypothetical protein
MPKFGWCRFIASYKMAVFVSWQQQVAAAFTRRNRHFCPA